MSLNRDGYTPTLKIILKFLVKLVLLRKQSFNFPVVFSKNVHFQRSRRNVQFFPTKKDLETGLTALKAPLVFLTCLVFKTV